jgi:hypothetical protein
MDPILGNRATKHYTYAANNPVSMIDPFGLDEEDWAAVKPYLVDPAWVKSHSRLVLRRLENGQKTDVFSQGGQATLDKAYQSYQAALASGDAKSAYMRLRDLQVAYFEGPEVLESIYSSKEKLLQYLLIVQGSAAGINLQGLASAQAITKMINTINEGGSRETKFAKKIASGEKPDVNRGLWDEFDPGGAVERKLGGNLPANFPTIDKFEGGVATSIKSLDLGAQTYQTAEGIASRVENYVDKLAKFKGRTWGGVTIKEADITARVLDIAIPPGATKAQQDALNKVAQYGAGKGVTIRIIEIK